MSADIARPGGDPRVNQRNVRCLPGAGDEGTLLLVGVVHDHPASTYRVVHLLDLVTPDVLALELPPLAMPLFRLYAADEHTPPRLGGEMSAAIQAADRSTTVGIDAPSGPYLRELGRALLSGTITREVSRTVLTDLRGGLTQAVACRLAAVLGSVVPVRLAVYTHIDHDASLLDDPATQAAHESAHFAQQRAFLSAVEVPEATRVVDAAREASMADELTRLRARGDVMAVVGIEHLDALADALAG